MPKETWKDVPGYEGNYQVSNRGRVRSVDHRTKDSLGRWRDWPSRVLSPGYAGRTRCYAYVNLCRQGKYKVRYIHDLVLLAFVGPKPEDKVVRHGIEGSFDNSLTNLSYGTASENQLDRHRDGTANSKPVRRSDGKEYPGVNVAARDMGINHSNISMVLSGKHQTAGGFTWEFI